MAFKESRVSIERDVEGELSDIWKRRDSSMAKPIEDETIDDSDIFHDIKIISPPQPLLPPINPLLPLKDSKEERKLAATELVLNQIHSKAAQLATSYDWHRIIEKKKQLQELFTTAERGINENRASMARFYEIIKESSKDKEALEQELEITQQRIEEYREVEEEFTHYVNKYSVFERFLEDVTSVEEGWRNVRDVLNRYETLQNTSSECARILENEMEQSAELRKRMMTLVEEKSNQLKSLSNRLILLEVQRKDARDRRVYWEHMMQRIKYTTLDKTIDTISLKEGIKDLYQCMCSRLRILPTIPANDVEGQVDCIHKNILFFKEVVTIASGCKGVGMEYTDVKTLKPKVKKTK